MKFALCVWLPTALRAAKKLYRKQGMKAYTVPLGVSAVGLLTVIGGKDLGTAMILIFIGIVAFLIAGFPGKWMGIGVLVMAAMVAVLAISSPNRMRRILATYGGLFCGRRTDGVLSVHACEVRHCFGWLPWCGHWQFA